MSYEDDINNNIQDAEEQRKKNIQDAEEKRQKQLAEQEEQRKKAIEEANRQYAETLKQLRLQEETSHLSVQQQMAMGVTGAVIEHQRRQTINESRIKAEGEAKTSLYNYTTNVNDTTNSNIDNINLGTDDYINDVNTSTDKYINDLQKNLDDYKLEEQRQKSGFYNFTDSEQQLWQNADVTGLINAYKDRTGRDITAEELGLPSVYTWEEYQQANAGHGFTKDDYNKYVQDVYTGHIKGYPELNPPPGVTGISFGNIGGFQMKVKKPSPTLAGREKTWQEMYDYTLSQIDWLQAHVDRNEPVRNVDGSLLTMEQTKKDLKLVKKNLQWLKDNKDSYVKGKSWANIDIQLKTTKPQESQIQLQQGKEAYDYLVKQYMDAGKTKSEAQFLVNTRLSAVAVMESPLAVGSLLQLGTDAMSKDMQRNVLKIYNKHLGSKYNSVDQFAQWAKNSSEVPWLIKQMSQREIADYLRLAIFMDKEGFEKAELYRLAINDKDYIKALKEGKFVQKVLTSPAMVEGVYLPAATMGVSYGLGIGASGAFGPKVALVIKRGTSLLKYPMYGAAAIGVGTASASSLQRPGGMRQVGSILFSTGLTFAAAQAGYKAAIKTQKGYHITEYKTAKGSKYTGQRYIQIGKLKIPTSRLRVGPTTSESLYDFSFKNRSLVPYKAKTYLPSHTTDGEVPFTIKTPIRITPKGEIVPGTTGLEVIKPIKPTETLTPVSGKYPGPVKFDFPNMRADLTSIGTEVLKPYIPAKPITSISGKYIGPPKIEFQNLRFTQEGFPHYKPITPTKTLTPSTGKYPGPPKINYVNMIKGVGPSGIEVLRPKIEPSVWKTWEPPSLTKAPSRIVKGPGGVDIIKPTKITKQLTPSSGKYKGASKITFKNLNKPIVKEGYELYTPKIPGKVLTPSMPYTTRTGIIKSPYMDAIEYYHWLHKQGLIIVKPYKFSNSRIGASVFPLPGKTFLIKMNIHVYNTLFKQGQLSIPKNIEITKGYKKFLIEQDKYRYLNFEDLPKDVLLYQSYVIFKHELAHIQSMGPVTEADLYAMEPLPISEDLAKTFEKSGVTYLPKYDWRLPHSLTFGKYAYFEDALIVKPPSSIIEWIKPGKLIIWEPYLEFLSPLATGEMPWETKPIVKIVYKPRIFTIKDIIKEPKGKTITGGTRQQYQQILKEPEVVKKVIKEIQKSLIKAQQQALALKNKINKLNIPKTKKVSLQMKTKTELDYYQTRLKEYVNYYEKALYVYASGEIKTRKQYETKSIQETRRDTKYVFKIPVKNVKRDTLVIPAIAQATTQYQGQMIGQTRLQLQQQKQQQALFTAQKQQYMQKQEEISEKVFVPQFGFGELNMKGIEEVSYIPQVKVDATKKHKARWVSITKEPLPMNQAKGIAAYVTDNTVSRSFKLKESKKKPKPNPSYNMLWGTKQHKFRPKIKKGQKMQNPPWIEKTKYAIDTTGEFQGITVQGWKAQRNKPTKKQKRTIKRYKSKEKPLYGLGAFEPVKWRI